MLPSHLEITGIASVTYDCELGVLRLRVQLSDGSTAAAYWEASDLRRFMSIVTPPTHTPMGASLQ
jgi:hypothetical protein